MVLATELEVLFVVLLMGLFVVVFVKEKYVWDVIVDRGGGEDIKQESHDKPRYVDSARWCASSAHEESAETGPPRVIVYGYDGLPIQPVATPSPDYVPGPEHPPSPDYVPDPEHPPSPVEIPYVPEPEYPEYLAPSDDEEHLKDQPLPADASPVAASPDYVADFDPKEDPEEDPEDDQADYLTDGGDGDDEPSDNDNDDDIDDEDPDDEHFEDEEDDEEEEEHLAPADSFVVPIVDLVLPTGDTEALEADEPTHTPRLPHILIHLSQIHLCRAHKAVRPEPPMSASMEACIARHAALLSPPLPDESFHLLPAGLIFMRLKCRLRKGLALQLPILDSRLRRVPQLVLQGSWCYKAAGATRQPGPIESDLRRYRVEQAGYGITDTWDEIVDTLMEIAPTTLEGDDRALLRARVNTLFRDRPNHRRTAILMDREAMYAREAWACSEDRSSAIAAHVRTLEAQVDALIA
nr:hypothetical protein [Tanacetum cinerariifolium]